MANSEPTGEIIIIGQAKIGETLSADTSKISDNDGLTQFSYQWLRDGVVIENSDQATYQLKDADLGKKISIAIFYLDGADFDEYVESSQTQAVQQHVNHAPTGNVTISGTAQVGQTLTASNNLADADGMGIVSYIWRYTKDGSGYFDVPNATQSTYTLTASDVDKSFYVRAYYTDLKGNNEKIVSDDTKFVTAATQDNVNHAPTGTVTVSGTPQVGQTLTASNTLTDADGMGIVSYIWRYTEDSRNYFDVPNALQSTYILTKNDVGKIFYAMAYYTDLKGHDEKRYSYDTEPVKATQNGVTKTGDAKANKFDGTAYDDSLSGLAGNDTLNGNNGDDNLTGGFDFDTLAGGKGADKFIFTDIKDATISKLGIEVITDFNSNEKDKIVLSTIDADSTKTGNQAFSNPVVGAKFSGTFTKAGQLFFDTTSHILYGNVNQDGAADFAIQLNGVKSLVAGDLML